MYDDSIYYLLWLVESPGWQKESVVFFSYETLRMDAEKWKKKEGDVEEKEEKTRHLRVGILWEEDAEGWKKARVEDGS